MSRETAAELLAKGEYGFLATVGADGQPYGVPLNYVFKDNRLYFHCAPEGHKLDNLRTNGQVSFCVVGRTRVLPDRFTTEYESALAFGTASVVQGSERQEALMSLLEKYSPDFLEEGKRFIVKYDDKVTIVRIDIKHLSGKARR
jgi:nitroimidazol reductase NimA-like FMN-containing flavoprotein (pyridoxamine 5'-phosphate oxidase superfamily)